MGDMGRDGTLGRGFSEKQPLRQGFEGKGFAKKVFQGEISKGVQEAVSEREESVKERISEGKEEARDLMLGGLGLQR